MSKLYKAFLIGMMAMISVSLGYGISILSVQQVSASSYSEGGIDELKQEYELLQAELDLYYSKANEALLSFWRGEDSKDSISKYKWYSREISNVKSQQRAIHEEANKLRALQTPNPVPGPTPTSKCGKVYLKHMPSNTYPQLAYNISGCNKEFMYMLSGENIDFNPNTKAWDVKGYAYGFCQFNDAWHGNVIFDSRFKNPSWQLQQCYNHWEKGTKFYGYKRTALIFN